MTEDRAGRRPRPGATSVIDAPWSELAGASLRWKRYRRWTEDREGACEICGARFRETLAHPHPVDHEGDSRAVALVSGYSIVGGGPAGQDDYRWICAICYESFRDYMGWHVLDTRDRPIRPAGLWEAAFGFRESEWDLMRSDD